MSNYPRVFNSTTGQWTNLFDEAVNIDNIGGVDINSIDNDDILVYNSASSNFINESINELISDKDLIAKSMNISETLIVGGQLITGSGSATVTTEQIQDAAAPLFDHSNHVNISASYDDVNNRINLTVPDPRSDEEVRDLAASLLNHNEHTGVTVNYDDGNDKLILSASVDLNVSTEEIQDAAAPLLNHNFHTNISVTYDDENNRILLTGAAVGGSGSAAPITNFYDIVRDFGAVSNETDSKAKIQNALNAARDAGGGTVYIPTGLWNLSGGLRIYSNTTLIMSEFAYMRKLYSGGSMLWNGDNGASYSGYNGQINITIIGGDWDCRGTAYPTTPANIFSFAHGENIKIERTTFRNVGGYHAIEINSSKNVRIKDCRFIGFIDTGDRDFSEAVQIDGAFRATLFGEFGSYDKTVCKDVVVEGCYFGPSGFGGTTSWPTGVGSHSADTESGAVLTQRWHEEIKVINNTFDGMTEYGVRSDAVWREALVQGNVFSNCSGGVGIGFKTRTVTESWHPSYNFSIENNIFQESLSTGRDCITARNVDGVVISGNHFRPSPASTTGRHGVYLTDCTEGLVTSNRIEWVMRHGIFIEASDDCMVTNNMIKNVSTETNNTYSFIHYSGTPTDCSTIGNRMYKGGAGNTALYGVRIVNGTGMRTFGNFAGTAATTPYLDGSTSPSTSTANA